MSTNDTAADAAKKPKSLPEVAREIFQLAIDSKDAGLGQRLIFFEEGADPELKTLREELQGIVDRQLSVEELEKFAVAGETAEQTAMVVDQAHRAQELIDELVRLNEQAEMDHWRYAD